MRASLTALLPLILLAACSQAPVQPSAAQAAATCPAPATTAPVCPPPPTFPMTPIPVQEVPVDKDHREVLMLNAWEGLDYGEMATVLGCSRNAVRIRIHRARTRLAAELDAISAGWH